MKRRSLCASVTVATLLAVIGAGSARAEFYSGREFAKDLDEFFKPIEQVDKNRMFKGGMAVGFIKGVCDTLEGEGLPLVPAKVTVGELAIVLRDYLKKHPDDLDEPAAILVRMGLDEKYPSQWPK
jgi:hypothetical protein